MKIVKPLRDHLINPSTFTAETEDGRRLDIYYDKGCLTITFRENGEVILSRQVTSEASGYISIGKVEAHLQSVELGDD